MEHFDLPHNHGDLHKEDLLRKHVSNTTDFQVVADLFRLLDDCNRLRIFWLLCHCEECVINISAMVDMTSPAVSHHLKQLKASGLIVSRREGKEVYYKAADTATSQLLHKTIEQLTDIVCP